MRTLLAQLAAERTTCCIATAAGAWLASEIVVRDDVVELASAQAIEGIALHHNLARPTLAIAAIVWCAPVRAGR